MTALLLLPLAACAGTYVAVYTGGTATLPSFLHRPPTPYAQGTSTVNGGSYSGYGGDASAATGEAASCSGQITATLTWQPAQGQTSTSDPPPTTVIVQETSMASASGMCTPVAPVVRSCDNGIGVSQSSLTQTPNVYPGPPPVTIGTWGRGFCYRVRYKVMPGQQVLTLNPTPSTSISASPTDVEPGGSVRYSASATPVTVYPGGTLNPLSAPMVLTGQQITASLSSAYSVDSSTYKWSSTGDVFRTYNENAPSHQLVLLSDDPSYTNQATFPFYDKTAENITVTCSATLVVPDGTRLPVTVKSLDAP